MTMIRAAHYGETVEFLRKSPIIQNMLMNMAETSLADITHDDGESPRWEFMLAASRQYDKLSKLNPEIAQPERMHIGGVAEAMIAERKATAEACAPFLDAEIGEGEMATTLRKSLTERGTKSAGLLADIEAAAAKLTETMKETS